ncbi:hypothetical protein [Chengkuizengella marina]|uniref:hypothetical protein n=1 Tax=Chengkuizengella marina TaxID=2507566 RepID=UPI0013715978|nr:hypothetical protein [Chengkuizengella marina]
MTKEAVAKKVFFDECINEKCGKEIYEGEKYWFKGNERFCSCRCLSEHMGAVKLKAGE